MDAEKWGVSIDNELQIAETKRLKNNKTVAILFYVFIGVAIIVAGVVFYYKMEPLCYLFSVGLLVIPFVFKSYSTGNLRKFVKTNLIAPSLKKLRPNLQYNQSHFISSSEFNASNLFSSPDRYSGEDLISGINKKTKFSFSEIHAEQKSTTTDSKGRTRTTYSTIFKGIFMIADFNKLIKNETYVYTSGGKWLSRFKRVKMEDPIFEKRFNVYSDDQIEARYILTPSMMKRITDLEYKYNCQLFMSFIGSKIFIAMGNTKNHFEPEVGSEITEKVVTDVVKEIDSCIAITEDLDLNTRIWTKK